VTATNEYPNEYRYQVGGTYFRIFHNAGAREITLSVEDKIQGEYDAISSYLTDNVHTGVESMSDFINNIRARFNYGIKAYLESNPTTPEDPQTPSEEEINNQINRLLGSFTIVDDELVLLPPDALQATSP